MRDAIRKDCSKFYPKPEYPYKRMEVSHPLEKPPYEKGKHPGLFIGNIRELATRAILSGGDRKALGQLRAEARSIIPSLIFPTELPGSSRDRLGMVECVMPGNSCAVQGKSPKSCCGNDTSCVHVPDLEASFCVATGL